VSESVSQTAGSRLFQIKLQSWVIDTTCNVFPGGFMEKLDGRWILVKDAKCPEKNTSPATLGLTNMAGNAAAYFLAN